MSTTRYSKYDPHRVHMVNGCPVIYNKADRPILLWDAERGFKAAVSAMHTWAARTFRLAAANSDPELRAYELEYAVEWQLDKIETWLGAMRKALEEQRGEQREQDKIDKLLALAERTPFEGEAETARRMAAERQAKRDNHG